MAADGSETSRVSRRVDVEAQSLRPLMEKNFEIVVFNVRRDPDGFYVEEYYQWFRDAGFKPTGERTALTEEWSNNEGMF
jgi:hypothetical protein